MLIKTTLIFAAFSIVLQAAPDFGSTVYPVLMKAGCVGCHNHDGVASATRLHFPEESPTPAQINAFGQSLYVLVNAATPDKSLLLLKPTARIAHAGGKRIEPGSPEESALIAWINYLAKNPPSAANTHASEDPLKPQGPIVRRLTHAQYNNTIRDLLNDQTSVADQFPPEDFVNGFRNQYLSQSTSPLLAEAYSAAAEKLSKKAFLGGDTQSLIPCKPKSFDDAVCRGKFIADFGRRAFRRPLNAQEMARYNKLFNTEAASSRQFLSGAQLVVEVMLQSPNFLLRSENGLDTSLKPYEIASTLSYFLWNSSPDEVLLTAAAKGDLNSPQGIETQARRMLQSPKAREAIDEFLTEWLRLDRLNGTVRERRLYPQFSPELTLAMTEETRRLAHSLIWNKSSFMEFFSAPYTYVNSQLAKLYGLDEPKSEYERVDLADSTQRAGILSQGSFLTMTSKPGETSPTARGLFVREQFLCQDVPQPPPGVNANLPPVTREKPMTQRQRLSTHLTNPSCASCHDLIDPIGLGLEKFDAIGAYRAKLKLTVFPARFEKKEAAKTVDLELDTTGNIAGLPNAGFTSPRELGKILAGSPQCQQCVVKQLFRYMAGRHESKSDRLIVDQAFADFKNSGFQLQELMVSLAKWSVYSPKRGN